MTNEQIAKARVLIDRLDLCEKGLCHDIEGVYAEYDGEKIWCEMPDEVCHALNAVLKTWFDTYQSELKSL